MLCIAPHPVRRLNTLGAVGQVEKERYVLVHKLAKAGRHAEASQYALPLCRSICSAAAAAQVRPQPLELAHVSFLVRPRA